MKIIVHFINYSGDDVYIYVRAESDAANLVKELRLLKVPAAVVYMN